MKEVKLTIEVGEKDGEKKTIEMACKADLTALQDMWFGETRAIMLRELTAIVKKSNEIT
jgi:hypothetical protein